MPDTFLKDPNAQLDYKFEWSDWLESGEVISSYSVTVSTGLTKVTDSKTNTSVTVWLSGGTVNTTYEVVCRITTNSNPARTEDRTMTFKVMER